MGDTLFESLHIQKYVSRTLLVNDILAKYGTLGLHFFFPADIIPVILCSSVTPEKADVSTDSFAFVDKLCF